MELAELARSLYSAQLFDEALAVYTQLSLCSDSALVQTMIGLSTEHLARYTEALGAYEHAISIDPGYCASYNNKGNLLRKLGFVCESVTVFMLGLCRCGANKDLYNNLGNSYLLLNQIVEAEQCYQFALLMAPNMAAAHCNLAAVWKRQGRISEAFCKCGEALDKDPGCAEAYAHIRQLLLERPHEIICNIDKILPNSNSPLVLYSLGSYLKDAGLEKQALACFEKAL